MGSRHFWGLATSVKCKVSNSRGWWSFQRVWIRQSSAAYSAHNRDGRIDAQLLVIQIGSRGGKVFQRSIPSENTLYQIVCGIRRFMVEKNPAIEFSPLDSSDKSCVNWRYWRGGRSLFLIRCATFRQILDAEMKDGTRAGVCLKAKKEMYCKL